MYEWFGFIINRLLPFPCVEKKVFIDNVKHEPMPLSNFMRYLPLLTELVENESADKLSNKFAIVFDIWLSRSARCTTVFAVHTSSSPFGLHSLTHFFTFE